MTKYTASDMEVGAGLSVYAQRDLRRLGLLRSHDGAWARYSLIDIFRARLAVGLSRFGISQRAAFDAIKSLGVLSLIDCLAVIDGKEVKEPFLVYRTSGEFSRVDVSDLPAAITTSEAVVFDLPEILLEVLDSLRARGSAQSRFAA